LEHLNGDVGLDVVVGEERGHLASGESLDLRDEVLAHGVCDELSNASARRRRIVLVVGSAFRYHRMPLGEAPQAYEAFQKKDDGTFKVVFKP
jgi:hypothetical protein